MGKHIFFVVPYSLKFRVFFYKMFMIPVAVGAVKIRIGPEASVFRGDAYFDGPGAQKYHF